MKLFKVFLFAFFLTGTIFCQSNEIEIKIDGKSSATHKTHKPDGKSSATQKVDGMSSASSQVNSEFKRIAILWTSNDIELFTKVVYPYALNSKKMKWWDEVTLIIWGPSSKLLAENKTLHENISKLREAGVILTACKWCSDQYKVSDTLGNLEIDVKYMGKPLSEFLQNNVKVLSF